MPRIALPGLILLLPLTAVAQTPAQPTPSPRSTPASPLPAMHHQQPRRAAVDQREDQRFGQDEAQRQQHQRSEIDQLYQEIMRQSTPLAAHP